MKIRRVNGKTIRCIMQGIISKVPLILYTCNDSLHKSGMKQFNNFMPASGVAASVIIFTRLQSAAVAGIITTFWTVRTAERHHE